MSGSILLLEDGASAPAPPKPAFSLAIDASNYSGVFSPSRLQAYWDRGIRLIIIQAFPPYTSQYKIQTQQMQQCVEFGMPFDCYIYDYLASPDWRTSALSGLKTIVWQPVYVWADEEDTAAMPVAHRVAAVRGTLNAIEEANYATGIYTGAWWWRGYLNNTTAFSNYLLWDSHYDYEPNPDYNFQPYGGWERCEIKQYAGSQPDGTDLNVFRVH